MTSCTTRTARFSQQGNGLLTEHGTPFGALLRYRNVWILTPDTSLRFRVWRSGPYERIYAPFYRCGCVRWPLLVVTLLRMTDGGRL